MISKEASMDDVRLIIIAGRYVTASPYPGMKLNSS